MTPAEINEWITKHNIKECTIEEDCVLNVGRSVTLWKVNELVLPVQFGTVTGYFDISHTNICSLRGIPHTIHGSFACIGTPITSLSGIHKIVKHIGGRAILPSNITHVLGVLLIDGVTSITIGSATNPVDFKYHLERILNKYLPTQDAISAQDELIDAGYIEQAKL